MRGKSIFPLVIISLFLVLLETVLENTRCMYATSLLLCSSLAPLQNLSFNWSPLGRSSSVFGEVPLLTLHAFVHCFPNQCGEVSPELQEHPYCDPLHDKGLSLVLHYLLLHFSHTCKLLSSKATFTTAFFTAINHNIITITSNKPWN